MNTDYGFLSVSLRVHPWLILSVVSAYRETIIAEALKSGNAENLVP